MPKVSVIVPVYNSEVSLKKCVKSILAQEEADFELILVDDGSIDGSGNLCDSLADSDDRITTIHQQNCGAAAARNVGLDVARGEYLAFCDSDDVVSPFWLKRLLAFSGSKTLPICAYCVYENELGEAKKLAISAGTEYSRENYLDFNHCGIAGFLWNALYEREVVFQQNLRFREMKEKGDYNEDLLFATEYVKNIKSLIYTGYADYCYNMREDSLSRKNSDIFFEKYAEKYRIWYAFAEIADKMESNSFREVSNNTLYFFLGALREASRIEQIRQIICSQEMKRCLVMADLKRENQLEIKMVQREKAFSLFCFYKAVSAKRKIIH